MLINIKEQNPIVKYKFDRFKNNFNTFNNKHLEFFTITINIKVWRQ